MSLSYNSVVGRLSTLSLPIFSTQTCEVIEKITRIHFHCALLVETCLNVPVDECFVI